MSIYFESKPSILISMESAELPEVWQEVLFGIEEEGIPYKLLNESNTDDVISRAYSAAQTSALAVGIACTSNKMVIHHKNLPEQQPLFNMEASALTDKLALRDLGNNAARLIKGIPFKQESHQLGE
ncbi:MAG: glycerol dehydratase reactivase beta/small subunit family protein [Shewanella sp.]